MKKFIKEQASIILFVSAVWAVVVAGALYLPLSTNL